MPALDRRLAVNTSEVAAKVVDGEAVVINLSTGVYYSLPGTGGAAWALLAAGADGETAAAELASRFGAPLHRVRADVEQLVVTLLEEGLMVEAPAAGEPADLPSLPANGAYEPPTLEKYTDLGDLLALDPPMPGITDIPWTRPAD